MHHGPVPDTMKEETRMKRITHKYINDELVEIYLDDYSQLSKLESVINKLDDHTIVLVIRSDLRTLHIELGKLMAGKADFQNDQNAYELIGKVALDYYIPKTYFVKSIAENKVYEIRGVKDEIEGS